MAPGREYKASASPNFGGSYGSHAVIDPTSIPSAPSSVASRVASAGLCNSIILRARIAEMVRFRGSVRIALVWDAAATPLSLTSVAFSAVVPDSFLSGTTAQRTSPDAVSYGATSVRGATSFSAGGVLHPPRSTAPPIAAIRAAQSKQRRTLAPLESSLEGRVFMASCRKAQELRPW